MMKRLRQIAGALLVVGALAATLAGVGAAQPGTVATIQEALTSNGNHEPPTGTLHGDWSCRL